MTLPCSIPVLPSLIIVPSSPTLSPALLCSHRHLIKDLVHLHSLSLSSDDPPCSADHLLLTRQAKMEYLQPSTSSSIHPPPIRPTTKRTASMVSLPTPPGTEDLTFLDGADDRKSQGDKRKASRMEVVDEEDPFAAPTASSRTARTAKRARFSGVDSSDEEEQRDGEQGGDEVMDSPSNPFKAKKGERVRRSEEATTGSSNKITYVL